jgi:hypothetical protein
MRCPHYTSSGDTGYHAPAPGFHQVLGWASDARSKREAHRDGAVFTNSFHNSVFSRGFVETNFCYLCQFFKFRNLFFIYKYILLLLFLLYIDTFYYFCFYYIFFIIICFTNNLDSPILWTYHANNMCFIQVSVRLPLAATADVSSPFAPGDV